MTINPDIFRAYDVRAIYPSEINEEAAAAIAKAFAFLLNADKIVVGRDSRSSSGALHKAIVNALVDVGVHVYDIGECPTPLLLYATAKMEFAGGMIISPSHSPSEYAGIKLERYPNLQMCIPGEMEEIKKLAMNKAVTDEVKEKKGKVEKFEILNEYIEEICTKFVEVKGLKVVVDYGNGMGAITAKPVFEKLGLNIVPMYEEVDLTFPNHPSNPMEEKNIEELRKRVVEEKADLGIAFDGDADRAICIDDNGEVVYPDLAISLLIPFELKGRSEKKVYYDLRFSKIVDEVLKNNQGEGVMMRVGNPFYKSKLTQEGGVFGAELSGHMFFQDHYNIDDGLYGALKIMNVIVQSKKKLSELTNPLKKYFQSNEINTKVQDPDKTIEKIKNSFSDGKLLEIDGIRIDYPDWWFSLRKSNTEPVVRLRLEANSKEKLDEMQAKLVRMVEEA